jgi:phosphoribosylanthranilate isomerase
VGRKLESKVLESADWVRLIPPALSVFLLTDRTDPSVLGELIAATNCDTVQLQGTHSNEDIALAARFARANGRKLVRTVAVLPDIPFKKLGQEAREAESIADAILFDSARYGGTGRAHDWSITGSIGATLSKPFILAGGLNPDNCKEAIRQVRPWGIDAESGVEDRFVTSRNQKATAKNFSKIAALVTAARGTAADKHSG